MELRSSIKSSEPRDYISNRTRGGLVTPCKDLVNILKCVCRNVFQRTYRH